MKNLAATLAAFLTFSLQGFAMVDLANVKAATAEKDYGIKIKTHQYNPHQVGVTLEFKPEGDLKGFEYVDMRIMRGDHFLVLVALPVKTENGVATARYDVDPSVLRDSEITIYNYGGPHGDVGYRIKVKEFLPADGRNDTENKKPAAPVPADSAPAIPAAPASPAPASPAPPATPAPASPKRGR